MKITLVQRISQSINAYKSTLYDTNLSINLVSWFQELYPSVLFRNLVEVKDFSEILPKTTFQFTCKSDFSFTCKSDFSFTYITLFRSTNSCIACKANSLRVFFSIFFSIISWK